MSTSRYIKLAAGLPPRLTRFFAQYPPKHLLEPAATSPNTLDSPLTATNTSPVDSAIAQPESVSAALKSQEDGPISPFRAWRNPVTGRWQDPAFSLRRQAELVKLARAHGVEELLPHSIKGTAERLKRREENGLRVKGTGVGQKVKGKAWERTLKGRLEKRRQAMLEMPQMIQTWKERGHGRGWKKWPK